MRLLNVNDIVVQVRLSFDTAHFWIKDGASLFGVTYLGAGHKCSYLTQSLTLATRILKQL